MLKQICIGSFAIASVVFSGCAFLGGTKKGDDSEEASEQTVYERAQRSIRARNFDDAIYQLELLETRFPFGRQAEQAQLELIYVQFMKEDFDAALAAADRFIELHPDHPKVDYAYFLKGLSHFRRHRSFFDRLFGAPQNKKDTLSLQQSFTEFERFLTLFPGSAYAKDAQLRMKYLRNVLAEYEINVARFYLSREAWVAAANRAREVIAHYPKAEVIPEAVAILVEANYKLGLEDAATDAARVLALNFPEFEGFERDGTLRLKEAIRDVDRSWINMLSFGLLDRPRGPPPIRITVPRPTTDTAGQREPN